MGIINFLRNYQRMARFRWGNFEGMKGPGPVWLIPIMHSGTRVDLRTEVLDIARQTNITKDNAPIDIDFLVYMRVMEDYADRAVLEVENYRAAVIGLVEIIREGHPDIPLALISPIGYPPHETVPNMVGYTIQGMRDDIEDACDRLVRRGDGNLSYFDGLELFNLDEIARYAEDQCHPDADGIEVPGHEGVPDP